IARQPTKLWVENLRFPPRTIGRKLNLKCSECTATASRKAPNAKRGERCCSAISPLQFKKGKSWRRKQIIVEIIATENINKKKQKKTSE
uniref:Uncharacterized protein n=1 Tax=Anopheles dirus TaxID=7168 RepID=A0A182NXK7_9DIPT